VDATLKAVIGFARPAMRVPRMPVHVVHPMRVADAAAN
jgi:hypothetical protein